MAQTYKTILFVGGDRLFVETFSFFLSVVEGAAISSVAVAVCCSQVAAVMLGRHSYLLLLTDGWVDTADRISRLTKIGSHIHT